MNSIFELSRPVEALRKEGKHKEALQLFKMHRSNFTQEEIAKNVYLMSDIVTCLRKVEQYDAGFKFLKMFDIKVSAETPGKILGSYGWLLYSKYKAENLNLNQDYHTDYFEDEAEDDSNDEVDFHYNKGELLLKIEELLLILIPQKVKFNDTLISNLFGVVLKSEKKKPAPNWRLVNDFCSLFNPEDLSKETSTIQVEKKGRMSDMELASDFENWYSYKTKALSKLRMWQECLDLSIEALENVENPHYSNDVWFSRRLTLAKRNLGNTEDTIRELETILKKKKEWFIQKELAELYLEQNQPIQAFKYAMDAINNFGPIRYKVHLLYLIGKILNIREEKEMAYKHLLLSKLIREDEDWKVPQTLHNELENFSQMNLPEYNLKSLLKELQGYWGTFNSNSSIKKSEVARNSGDLLQGEILRFLNENERGKDGFIKSGNKDYYFSISSNFPVTGKIKMGAKVKFNIVMGKNGREQARIVKVLD